MNTAWSIAQNVGGVLVIVVGGAACTAAVVWFVYQISFWVSDRVLCVYRLGDTWVAFTRQHRKKYERHRWQLTNFFVPGLVGPRKKWTDNDSETEGRES